MDSSAYKHIGRAIAAQIIICAVVLALIIVGAIELVRWLYAHISISWT